MREEKLNKPINPTEFAQNMACWTIGLDEAVRFLKEDFPIRRIDEELTNALKQMAQKHKIAEEEAKSIVKKTLGSENAMNFSNWLKPGKVKSIERESALKIAFAMQMTYEETETFLKRCWLDGFYMRDVKDVIYRHGLENEWSFDETDELVKAFACLDQYNPDPSVSTIEQEEELTGYLSQQYTYSVYTKEDLAEFIQLNKDYFGSFRRKAYEVFIKIYDQIGHELNYLEDVEYEIKLSRGLAENYERNTVSKEDICDWIVQGIPEMRKKGPRTFMLRLITEYIPDREAMSEIINKHKRKRDGKMPQVDRKLLILAWLLSEAGDMKEFQIGKTEDNFQEHIKALEDLLQYCGMAALDSRHPFDWIIMNAIYYCYSEENKELEYIEERMEKLLKILLN